MHIRMEGGEKYQTLSADKSELWTDEETKLLFKWREVSHIDNFINQINNILSKNPDQKFFIATDMEKNYSKLIKIYGSEKIKYLKRQHFDRSKEQQYYALADILLLSKCKQFYGSHWSSYSEIVTYFQNDETRTKNIFSNEFKINDLKIDENYFGKKIQNGNSIVSVCMNREENLKKCIISWLNVINCNEIVILDYGSSTPIKDELIEFIKSKNYDIKKIKFYRVNNVSRWNLTRAFNFAIKLCNYSNIYKFDCDDIVRKEVINLHRLNNNNFYSGFWEHARNNNELQIAGKLFFKYSDFIKVNGYNENITTYGWDDSDIISRLSKLLERNNVNINSFTFIQHSEESRNNFNNNLNASQNIQLNRILTDDKKIFKWNNYNNHADFELVNNEEFILKNSYNLNNNIINKTIYKEVYNFTKDWYN